MVERPVATAAEPLAGRRALVTGGGTGVGAAIALSLAEAGAGVTVVGRRREPLEATAARHPRIDWTTGDVTDARALAALVDALARRHGTAQIVVANAGAAVSRPFARTSPDDLQGMLELNVGGVFNAWHATFRPMVDAGWGRLVAVASMAGLKGYPYVSAYCAAKHAVVGLTRALALELARSGVSVNCVCPGFVDTPMLDRALDGIVAETGRSREEATRSLLASNPQGRFVRSDEVAAAVRYLCTDEAAAVTGQALAIGGGES